MKAALLYRSFHPPWGSQNIGTFIGNILRVGKPGKFCVPNRISGNNWTEFFKAHKPGKVQGKHGRMGCQCEGYISYIQLHNLTAFMEEGRLGLPTCPDALPAYFRNSPKAVYPACSQTHWYCPVLVNWNYAGWVNWGMEQAKWKRRVGGWYILYGTRCY